MKKNKHKLLEILRSISTPEELKAIDASKMKEIVAAFEANESDISAEFDKKMATVLGAVDKYRGAVNKHNASFVEQFGEFTEKFSKGLENLGGTITTSYEKNKPVNAAGTYKDMINQLSAINESVQKKPVPVWNWPQYAGVSVRNKNFENINPAVDGFNIGGYDDIVLVYDGSNNITSATYKENNKIKAVLTLSYSGNNLTEVIRTT